MKHAMVDIETLGTKPGAVILSIGAVEFKIVSGMRPSPELTLIVGEQFFCTIDIKSSERNGLKIDGETLEWWLKQDREVMKRSLTDGIPLDDALAQFTQWKYSNDITYLWGNSARFDFGLLEAAYIVSKKTVPWNHRCEMCYRTMKNLFPLTKDEKPAETNDHHDPISDCHWQIDYLFNLIQKYGIDFEACTQAK